MKITRQAFLVWEKLRDIPTGQDDCIELPFEHFEIGANREDIWHWFEDKFDVAVYDLMNKRPEEAK
jgi:hypothetical protein